MHVADAILKEFIAEFNEMLDRISMGLSSAEQHNNQIELIRSIYRDIHTIKGNAMMFGLPLTGRLTHSIENLLDFLRQKKASLTPDIISQLLAGLDLLQQISRSLSQFQREPELGAAIAQGVTAFETLYSRLNSGELQAPASQSSPALASQPAPIPEDVAAPKDKTLKIGPEEGAQETIRVNVQVLDNIMNIVGELVLVKNQLQQRVKNLKDEDVQFSQRLSLITSELQSEVMKTRMQPVGNVLNKFHRICRDLASELKKDIQLEINGAETELDRALLEAIRDPLMHIVRNSIDHGIESPEERKRVQKPSQGKIAISAFHEGGQVIIQITDNGKGIDIDRVRSKALEKGLVSAEKIPSLTEKNILALVFHPGFSTAETISNVSGRGVGMDVVKTNIEQVGGTVELESKWGKGTVTTLRIPLTLAIIPALVIGCKNQAFAIPQSRIVELIQIDTKAVTGLHIEAIEGSPFIRLRGQLIPIILLQGLFAKTEGLSGLDQRKGATAEESVLSIVILSAEGSIFGLIVDEIFDSTDIVVKPLGAGLDSVKLFSGATILGDGDIALTIDVTGIANMAHIKSRNKSHAEQNTKVSSISESIDYLLVELSEGGHYVLPLSTVHRLEKIQISDIQTSGDNKICLYRDSILPIFSLSTALDYREEVEVNGEASVIVLSRAGRLFGLRVQSILDIMSSSNEIDSSVSQRPEVFGGFIHDAEVYTIIDPFEVLDRLRTLPGGSGTEVDRQSPKRRALRQQRRILLAEDSRFFRKQIAQFLESSGYTVVTAEDGEIAFSIIQTQGTKPFDLILSDIEMPNMTGLQLAEAVRRHEPSKTLPMIAITSRFSASDISTGTKAGFDRYLEKLNRDELISQIDESLGIVV